MATETMAGASNPGSDDDYDDSAWLRAFFPAADDRFGMDIKPHVQRRKPGQNAQGEELTATIDPPLKIISQKRLIALGKVYAEEAGAATGQKWSRRRVEHWIQHLKEFKRGAQTRQWNLWKKEQNEEYKQANVNSTVLTKRVDRLERENKALRALLRHWRTAKRVTVATQRIIRKRTTPQYMRRGRN